MKVKHLWFITIIVICAISTSAYAGWNFGLGTGPTLMAIEGDIGLDSTLAGGPVDLNLDEDASDMSDLIDSAFGFSSYATDGKWMFQLSFAQLNLEGDAFTNNPNIWGHVDFDVTVFELTAEYPIYKNNGLNLNLLGGVRYTKHELKRTLHVGAFEQGRELDNNWTDGVIGLSLDVPIYTNWSWNTSLNAGYGGSEGCYTVKTGVTWRFYKGWSSTLFYKYAANEFEEESRGNADWYLYDIDEQYFGLAILYNW
ncbi:hypothetical protein [Desulfobacula sp.]|uniref:hypothetical protein n=1 Tax=Desulfobacula sp. TaxID=2593537 RepID=UPI002639C7BD|nr:hypothetical protein [Desulfobacula sp.]